MNWSNNIKKITTASVAALFLALGGCTDELTPDIPKNSPIVFTGEKTTYYMSFNLSMPDVTPTRAGNDTFVDGEQSEKNDQGSKKESDINNLLLIFFKKNGDYLTHVQTDNLVPVYPDDMDNLPDGETPRKPKVKEDDDSGTTGEPGEEGDEGDEGQEGDEGDKKEPEYEPIDYEKITWEKTVTVPVDFYNDKGDDVDSFIAIVNYDDNLISDLTQTPAQSDVNGGKPILWNRSGVTDTKLPSYMAEDGYFLMSTPGYFEPVGSKWEYRNYQVKEEGKKLIYPTPAQARLNPVDVFVERLAARVDLKVPNEIPGNAIEVLHGTDVYTLKFDPLHLSVQATEKTEFLGKSMPYNDGELSPDYYRTNYPSGFGDWINEYPGVRVFWASSPTYEGGKYPAKGNEDDDPDIKLDYIFNSDIFQKSTTGSNNGDGVLFINGDNIKKKNETDLYKQSSTYLPEHTFNFNYEEMNGVANPYAVPTSIVVFGRYSADLTSTDLRPIPEEEEEGDTSETSTEPGEHEEEKEEGPFYQESQPFTTLPQFTTDNLQEGFYLRDINLERTDNEANADNEDENKDLASRYKYSLYLKSNPNYKDKDGKPEAHNELFDAMLKEQYVIFKKYTDGTNETYQPLKAADPVAKVILGISNANRIWWNKDSIGAPNAYTLQIQKGWNASSVTLKDPDEKDENGKVIPGKSFSLVYARVSDYPAGGTQQKYTPLTTQNVGDANLALWEQLGTATYYHYGYGFFYTPIPHYPINNYKGQFNYKAKEETDTDGNKYTEYTLDGNLTGQFGVVRNHIYEITVNGISTPAYGRTEEDLMVLPTLRPFDDLYYFDIELQILPWNKFDYTINI